MFRVWFLILFSCFTVNCFGGEPPVMLAEVYDEKVDVTDYWVSEKLDGVRCYWNGSNMYTRNGNRIFAPDEWVKNLPKLAIDGELWSGRDSF